MNDTSLDVLLTRLETAGLFAQLALTSEEKSTIDRNRVNSRKAYDSALQLLQRLCLAPLDLQKVYIQLAKLRDELQQLGEVL